MKFFIKLGTASDTPETPDTPPTENAPLHRGAATEIEEIHQYIYAGGKLLRETISDGTTTKTLDFNYDNVGLPYSLIYNNGTATTTYYYITNLQGDVMYLVDSSGNEVSAYDYDPYGKIIFSATGELAEINPMRYRGYYYDTETGFYYLQSRYYDPEICRFINADSYASTGQGYIGYNMLAYCLNNPILCADAGGNAANPRFNTTLMCDGGTFYPKYITNQEADDVANIPVGCKNVAWSGCGPVATYNALQTLHVGSSLVDIISDFDSNGYLLFNGFFGTSPWSVADYFERRGYRTKMLHFSPENYNAISAMSGIADASILWYAYKSGNNITNYGAHFIEYHRAENGKFVAVNSGAKNGLTYFNNPYDIAWAGSRFYAIGLFIFDDRG
jgi:RHS repeat-associated protein